jgi:hypothetical protein
MVRVGVFLVFSAFSLGCAFETHPTGLSNGGMGDASEDAPNSGEDLVDPVEDGLDAVDGGLEPVGGGLDTVDLAPGEPVGGTVDQPSCTPAAEQLDCPRTSCDPATLRCSSFKLASRLTCSTCVSDSDCADSDHRCVPMYYGGERFPDKSKGFCMRIALPDPDELEEYECDEPFESVLFERQSLSGAKVANYCGVREDLTTCDAVRAFQNQALCPGGTDDECPDGGVCHQLGNGNNAKFCCTYECTDNNECLDSYGSVSSCNGYCGG